MFNWKKKRLILFCFIIKFLHTLFLVLTIENPTQNHFVIFIIKVNNIMETRKQKQQPIPVKNKSKTINGLLFLSWTLSS